MKNADIIRQ